MLVAAHRRLAAVPFADDEQVVDRHPILGGMRLGDGGDFGEAFGPPPDLFLDLAQERLLDGLARLDMAADDVPAARVEPAVRRTLAEEDLPVAAKDGASSRRRHLADGGHGRFALPSMRAS